MSETDTTTFDGTVSFTTRLGVPYYAVEMKPGDPIGYVIHTMFGSSTEEALWRKVQELTTALENARKDAWQPIETAPKDGSKFLGLTSAGDYAVVSRHDPGGEKRNPKHHYETWVCDFNSHLVEPTHWQPLPQPPSLTPPTEKAT